MWYLIVMVVGEFEIMDYYTDLNEAKKDLDKYYNIESDRKFEIFKKL